MTLPITVMSATVSGTNTFSIRHFFHWCHGTSGIGGAAKGAGRGEEADGQVESPGVRGRLPARKERVAAQWIANKLALTKGGQKLF